MPVATMNGKTVWLELHQAALRRAGTRPAPTERDLPSLLRQVTEQARVLAGARAALLVLLDEQGGPAAAVTAGMEAAEQAQLEARLRDLGWLEALWREREARQAQAMPLAGLLLGLPLCVDERAVAALVLVDSQAEEAVVQAWADYAALAIDHARLTERVRHLEEELAQSLAAQSAMVHEMSHRVRNSLQMAVGFLSYALARRGSGALEEAVRSAIDRIKGLGAIQEVLASTTDERVSFYELMRQALAVTVPEVLSEAHPLLHFEGPDVVLPAEQAKSLALAVNELVINAFRHGLGRSRQGSISVLTETGATGMRITVRDEGRGLPEDFDIRRDRGLGLTIARGLVERNLGGSLSLVQNERGTSAIIRFPLVEEQGEIVTGSDR
ncbi:MAG: hypothetical protein C4311_13830 [Chloroflexota bacterium]